MKLSTILYGCAAIGLLTSCASSTFVPLSSQNWLSSEDYLASGSNKKMSAYVYGNVTVVEFLDDVPGHVDVRDQDNNMIAYTQSGKFLRLSRVVDNFTVWSNKKSVTFSTPVERTIYTADGISSGVSNYYPEQLNGVEQKKIVRVYASKTNVSQPIKTASVKTPPITAKPVLVTKSTKPTTSSKSNTALISTQSIKLPQDLATALQPNPTIEPLQSVDATYSTTQVPTYQSNTGLRLKTDYSFSGDLLGMSEQQLAEAQAVLDQVRQVAQARELANAQDKIQNMQASMLNQDKAVVRVNFASGSSDFVVTPETAKVILKAAANANNINLRGRTDSRISTAIDKKLSVNRALAARDFLIKNGVDDNKIRVFYLSKGDFIVPSVNAQTKALNRRVEIEFMNPSYAANKKKTDVAQDEKEIKVSSKPSKPQKG